MAVLGGRLALARARRAEGIDVVFGIVGPHNVALFETPGLRVIPTRHAGGAGFMVKCPLDGDLLNVPPPWL